MTASEVLVIGVGNGQRGDDGVGLAITERLAVRQLAGLLVEQQSGEALSLIAAWEGYDDVVLIDAACSGARPGTVHCFDAVTERLPERRFAASSHGFGVSQALELARALGRLPARCRVFAVEGAGFDHGAGLSPALAGGLDDIVEEIAAAVTTRATADA